MIQEQYRPDWQDGVEQQRRNLSAHGIRVNPLITIDAPVQDLLYPTEGWHVLPDLDHEAGYQGDLTDPSVAFMLTQGQIRNIKGMDALQRSGELYRVQFDLEGITVGGRDGRGPLSHEEQEHVVGTLISYLKTTKPGRDIMHQMTPAESELVEIMLRDHYTSIN